MVCTTHWDGHLDSLGQDLVRLVEGQENSAAEIELSYDYVLGVCMMHQVIALDETEDVIEYEYRIKDGCVEYRKLDEKEWNDMDQRFEKANSTKKCQACERTKDQQNTIIKTVDAKRRRICERCRELPMKILRERVSSNEKKSGDV